MAPSKERPRHITLRTTSWHHHIFHDVCVHLYQRRKVNFRAARKIQNNGRGGGGALDNPNNWLEYSTHRVRQLEKFREKLVKKMYERERNCKLKRVTYSFPIKCVSVCYERFKGKCLLRNYRISECFSLLKTFLLGCHDGNYIVCQTATTCVGSEFSLSCLQSILCAIQRTSIMLLQNFVVSHFSFT
jgi:hypothetical protein